MPVREDMVAFESCVASVVGRGGWGATEADMALRAFGLEEESESGGSWTEYCSIVEQTSYTDVDNTDRDTHTVRTTRNGWLVCGRWRTAALISGIREAMRASSREREMMFDWELDENMHATGALKTRWD